MEEETTGALLERTSRATRGKRMTKLLDDEADADEEFWGQDAFKEAAEDAEYEAEDDVLDEFDSDFDEDETNVEEEAPDDDDERFRVKKKKLLPPGTKLFKKDKKFSTPKTKGLDVIEAAVAAAIQPMADEPTPVQVPLKQTQEVNDSIENLVDLEGEKTVRKSTRTAVVVRQAEREALQAAMQATTIKPVKKKREGERRITQEDMLLEAAQTEILNRQNLERMMAREEEVKQKAIVHKTVYSGPQIRFYSRDGKNFLEFMGAVAESEELFGQAKPSSRRPLACVVTGLPAKYVDPLTGLPYATKEAFKIIRERVDKEEYNQREMTPGKKRRSARSFSGRPTVRKARRSILDAASRGYSFGMASGVEASPINIKANLKYETQQPYLPDESRTQDSIIDLTAQPVHGPSPQQPASLSKQLSETQAPKHGPLDQSEGLEYAENRTHSAVGSDAPAASLFQNLNMPLWVEIPPPREGPSEDDYSLDDLMSLNFGPILALQHGVTDHSEREHELDIDDPASVGTLLPLDLLPMPPDFGANVAL